MHKWILYLEKSFEWRSPCEVILYEFGNRSSIYYFMINILQSLITSASYNNSNNQVIIPPSEIGYMEPLFIWCLLLCLI